MLVTKAKIRRILNKPSKALKAEDGAQEALDFLSNLNGVSKTDSIAPNIGKMVRLTFHDCLNEVSGAGCNGCMNFHGMGKVYDFDPCTKQGTCDPESGPFPTDNNNLFWVAKVLETVYKDSSKLTESLYESGKSRADLWAFAGYVAIQLAVEKNNEGCKPEGPFPCINQVNDQSPRCDFELPEPNFKTGRSDCIPDCTGDNDYPFCTTNEEIHPSPRANGEETVKFFKDHFGFSPRQSAALMGVHTLGHPTELTSKFRHYPWTQQGKEKFNNDYYVQIVNQTGYRFRNPQPILESKGIELTTCGLPISYYFGNEYGDPNPVGYKVRSERRAPSSGPWDWSLFTQTCSTAICQELADAGEEYHMNSCCHWVDYCAANPAKCLFEENELCTDPDGSKCTKMDHFISESMLSPDIGLYYKFSTDKDGRPYGCPGMDNPKWIAEKSRTSDVTSCELNDTPAGDGMTIAEVMELYARDNVLWVTDFMAVFQVNL